MRRREFSSLLIAGAASARSRADAAAASAQPRTDASEAEKTAGVEPADPRFPAGDVRRYGASLTLKDNADAFNRALAVAAHGGEPVFVPAGRWHIARPLEAIGNGSMCGIGHASVIVAEDCDGIVFGNSGDYSVTGMSRSFRDFALVGNDARASSHRALVVDFSAASTARVNGALFENLYIANFALGAHLRGLWFSNFVACHLYNCHCGMCFIGQNCVNSIVDCSFNRGNLTAGGESWGVCFRSVDRESTQSTRIIGGQIYFFDVLIRAELSFELQIEHCDLSAAQSIGVHITATIGGCWLRDCWIETDREAPTTGVLVDNIQPSTFTSVRITGNHINCDVPHPGSRGIVIGNGNGGLIVSDNAVIGFDQGITLGASSNLICTYNRIKCVTPAYGSQSHALLLDSLAPDNEIGPNEIIPGEPHEARCVAGEESIHLADGAQAPPVGAPLQFEASANGFIAGVTYFVLESASGALRMGATPHGPRLASGGSAAMRVRLTPLPLRLTRSMCPGLAFHGGGACLLPLADGQARLLHVRWAANGRSVALSIDPTDVGADARLVARGLPEFLRPVRSQAHPLLVLGSSGPTLGLAWLDPDGGVRLECGAPDDGQGSGSGRTLPAQTLSYVLG